MIGSAVSLATAPLAGPVGLAAGVIVTSALEVGRRLSRQRSRRNSWGAAADKLADIAEARERSNLDQDAPGGL